MRNLIRAVLTLGLLVTSLFLAPTATAVGTHTVSGQAYEVVGGAEYYVPDVPLQLVGEDGSIYFTTTDLQGRFVFSNIPDGTYIYYVPDTYDVANGEDYYFSVADQVIVAGADVTADPQLVEGATLRATIQAGSGGSAAGAVVVVYACDFGPDSAAFSYSADNSGNTYVTKVFPGIDMCIRYTDAAGSIVRYYVAGDPYGTTDPSKATHLVFRGREDRVLTGLSLANKPVAAPAVTTKYFAIPSAGRPVGKAKVKKVLRAPSLFVAGATGVSYQWLRNGAPIAGQVGSSYKLVKKDKKKRVSVRIFFSGPGYQPASVTTASVKVK